jgi:hypothetical protein
LFLYLSQEIPAKSAVEFICIECVDEGSVVELLFSFAQKLIGLLKPYKEGVGGRRSLRVVILSKVFKDCCCRKCSESEGFNTREVVERRARGVRPNPSERIRVEKLRRVSTFVVSLREST